MISGAAVQITERRQGDVTVLRLSGVVNDTGLMVRLARQLLDARVDGGHVVLDLDGLDIEDPAALCALLARLGAASGGVPIPTCVTDPASRRLLRACGAGPAGLACFSSIDEAVDVARPTVALS
jgi:anti-anti-sigma regulatory factor